MDNRKFSYANKKQLATYVDDTSRLVTQFTGVLLWNRLEEGVGNPARRTRDRGGNTRQCRQHPTHAAVQSGSARVFKSVAAGAYRAGWYRTRGAYRTARLAGAIGVPLAQHAHVWAELTAPNSTASTLTLTETSDGHGSRPDFQPSMTSDLC